MHKFKFNFLIKKFSTSSSNSITNTVKINNNILSRKDFTVKIDEILNKMSEVILKNDEKNTVEIENYEYLTTRLNCIYLNCWLIKYHINKSTTLKLYQKLLFKFILKRKINKLNNTKFMYLFTDEKNKDIIDELNRSYRVINFSFDDFFLNENFMNRELFQIISDEKTFYTNKEEVHILENKIMSETNLNNTSLQEIINTYSSIETFPHLLNL